MELTIAAAEFKAKCLDILKRLGSRDLSRVTVTRRGRPVAVLTPPPLDETAAPPVLGYMAGSVWIDPALDLTQPVFEGEWEAEQGILCHE